MLDLKVYSFFCLFVYIKKIEREIERWQAIMILLIDWLIDRSGSIFYTIIWKNRLSSISTTVSISQLKCLNCLSTGLFYLHFRALSDFCADTSDDEPTEKENQRLDWNLTDILKCILDSCFFFLLPKKRRKN